MKLTTIQAAHWRRCVEAWFERPSGKLLKLDCPRCDAPLHIDGWKKLSTAFVERESLACSACGCETILQDDWVH
jgi:hypothetical protein